MKPDILNCEIRRPGGGAFVTNENADKLLKAGRVREDEVQRTGHGIAFLYDMELIAPPKLARIAMEAE